MSNILIVVQVALSVALIVILIGQLRKQHAAAGETEKPQRESAREMEQMRRLRAIALSEPLAERVRPKQLSSIVGQEDGIKALRALMCGSHPQHILIYGPPGVGKTCAARLMLEEAKRSPMTPFLPAAQFVEMDATSMRFDGRSIADPLIGSVHDPIYQGAGLLGQQGIPQPKPGAVTRAHGGVLFLDEIGELHPIQLNKLLKVLEDRKVLLESSYYNPNDRNIPRHIHDIFQNGLPADFRLIGATTRSPSEIPAAIRSRCMEVFFRPLDPSEVAAIAAYASLRIGHPIDDESALRVAEYAAGGRDAVNIVQMAMGLAESEKRTTITRADVEWVIASGRYAPRHIPRLDGQSRVGVVAGLAVFGSAEGAILDIEAIALPCVPERGSFVVTGIMEEEETGDSLRRMRRHSMASSSVEAVKTVLRQLALPIDDYAIHVNYPGGIPVDGPSAGLAMAVAVWSAVTCKPIDRFCAITGEISVLGDILPVGGVPAKIEAAARAGARRIIIPKENLPKDSGIISAQILPVDRIEDALFLLFGEVVGPISEQASSPIQPTEIIAAAQPT